MPICESLAKILQSPMITNVHLTAGISKIKARLLALRSRGQTAGISNMTRDKKASLRGLIYQHSGVIPSAKLSAAAGRREYPGPSAARCSAVQRGAARGVLFAAAR